MSARILDGKALAARLNAELHARVAARVALGRPRPGLAVVLVGENPASQIYVRNKRRFTEAVNMLSFSHDLPVETPEGELLALIDRLNADPTVHGILVQLPLPKAIDPERVTEQIDPCKDVDGFHPYNIGRLVLKRPVLRPCTPFGCMRLLGETGEDLVGKHAVIIGQSNIVGRPMALELLMARCTVTVCHSATRDLPGIVRQADVLVAAVGKAYFVAGDWIGADGMLAEIRRNSFRDDRGDRHRQQLGEDRKRLGKRQDDGRIIRSGDSRHGLRLTIGVVLCAGNRVERPSPAAFGCGVERALKARGDLAGDERLAVLELYSGSEVKCVGEAVR